MIRWSTAIVLVAVVATGCQGGSASPTSPSSAGTQPSPLTITGVVRDLLQRPIHDARIEVAEGPSSGLATITDALGQFSITATASSDRIAVIASKDGYDTATMRLRAGQTVILLRDSAVANLEGRAALVFTADASCTQLPASLRTRSYTAVVMPSTGAVMASPAMFVGELSGADFYQGYSKMWLMAARDAVRFNVSSWDAFNWWLEDQPIIERVTPTSHFSVSGTASAAVSNGQSTITTALDGTFAFCAESKPGAQPQWPPTCAVPQVECTSAQHHLTIGR
jgi:Carboxypeptidase regulatory-like domain